MITVFGSINIDLTFQLPHLPAVGETVLTNEVSQAIGGKGANQAMAAARDGAPTRFIGCVGSDGFGDYARASLAGLGIDVNELKTVPGATGLASVWVDTNGRNQIAVASGANRVLSAKVLAGQAINPQTLVVLQMEIPAGEVEAAVEYASRHGAKVILNLAPALHISPTALRQVDILVVNEHEAAVLCGALKLPNVEPSEQVVALTRELGNTVIITLGAEGAIAARGETVWRVDALPVTAIDTTGAGDCFVGVLASSLTQGAAIPEALRRAAAAGSLACTVVGATPSFPTRDKIDAALAGTGRQSD